MFDTILVPTDGSDHAERAAEHALHIAGLFDATVHALGVADVAAAAGPFNAGGVDRAFVERIEARAEDDVAAVRALATDPDRVRTVVRRGTPRETVLAYAEECGADLVAMGTHGRTGVDRYVAGSVTEGVLRRAPVPVLTARATERSRVDGYDEVLVPTDGSDPATAAVDPGVAVAAAGGGRVHAVHAVDVGDLALVPDYSTSVGAVDTLESAGHDAVEAVASAARAEGVESVTSVRYGRPARVLLEYVDENEIDLVAMGTSGRTGLSRFLLGSTAERVVRHSPAPVLAVNTRERSAED